MVPNCQEAGIFGAVAGTIGTVQAVETLKQILEIGNPLVNRLLILNALNMSFNTVNVKRDPRCRLCGENPSISEVEEYRQSDCDFENLPDS